MIHMQREGEARGKTWCGLDGVKDFQLTKIAAHSGCKECVVVESMTPKKAPPPPAPAPVPPPAPVVKKIPPPIAPKKKPKPLVLPPSEDCANEGDGLR